VHKQNSINTKARTYYSESSDSTNDGPSDDVGGMVLVVHDATETGVPRHQRHGHLDQWANQQSQAAPGSSLDVHLQTARSK